MESGGYTVSHIDGIFSHNPLHDLESFWWVGLWLLFCHYDSSNLEADFVQKHIRVVANVGYTLFGVNRSSRRDAFIHPDHLASSHPRKLPEAVKFLFVLLFKFRERLFSYYENYRPKESQDRSFFTSGVHDTCDDFSKEAIKSLTDAKDETKFWPI